MASLKKPNSILLLFVAVLFSCGGYSLHKYQTVGGEWSRGGSLAFMQDSAFCNEQQSLDLYVGVRYGAAYGYKNLWLQVSTFATDDSVISCDTVCCAIYDDKGRRNGSTAGTLYQAEYYVSPVLQNNVHTIVVQHIMQDSILLGVYDVGVKLVPRDRHQYEER